MGVKYPKYVIKRVSGPRTHFYFQKSDFRIPIPAPDDPLFAAAYEDAFRRLEAHKDLASSWGIHNSAIDPLLIQRHFSRLQMSARNRCKTTGRIYSLPPGWAEQRYRQQNFRCALTGSIMRFPQMKKDPLSPSIDRISSDRGYTPDNCHLVALRVNLCKSNLSLEEFVMMCRAVASTGRERVRNVG